MYYKDKKHKGMKKEETIRSGKNKVIDKEIIKEISKNTLIKVHKK